MEKIWAYIIDTVIAACILFISVTIYFGLRTETVMKSVGKHITKDFMFQVKRNGCFTIADYESFMEELNFTNALHQIEFEHIHSQVEPEYRFRTLEEIIEAQNAAYTGTNVYHYKDVVTVKPEVHDPINVGNLNTETNESVLAAAADTPASSSHVHTEECSTGHKHAGTNSFTHTHQHNNNCVEYEHIRVAYVRCQDCNTISQKILATWYWDEVSGSVKPGSPLFANSSCLACDNFNTSVTTASGYGYSCGYNKDLNNDGLNDAVGRAQAYQYIRPDPQDRTKKMMYTSGCYAYNNEVSIQMKTNDGFYYFYEITDLWNIYDNGINAYCNIPETYTIMYYWEGDYIALSFKLRITNGQARFDYSGGSNVSIYDSFPSITLQQLRDFYWDKYTLYNYLKVNVKSSFVPNPENCSSKISGMTGRIQVCDHTSHNTWYTTCDMEENHNNVCNQKIIKIVPTHPVQTVATGDPIITTAVVTYLDGSTRTVLCSSTFSTANTVKDQSVNLTYTYSIDGVQCQITCTILVTIIPRVRTCNQGHSYNLNSNGSDPGCPYCRAWVRELRILNPKTSAFTITIGTSLQENGVSLLAIYYDGHTETVTSEYIDNLDKQYLGTKPVMIGYKGETVQLMVTTVCAKMICDICGYEYSLYPDGSNPGCPRCIQRTPIFTGRVLKYDEAVYMEEIITRLYADGVYRFSLDDTFTIHLNNTSGSLARAFLNKLFPSLSDRWFSLSESEQIGMR